MIEFHLDKRSGVAPYQQIVQQVRHALRLGFLDVDDQLPTVKEVVAAMAVNAGHASTSHYLFQACPALEQFSKQIAGSGVNSGAPKPQDMNACITKLSANFHTILTYQPASRFWPFQWAEMGIFLAASLALCGLAYWWLRRRYA